MGALIWRALPLETFRLTADVNVVTSLLAAGSLALRDRDALDDGMEIVRVRSAMMVLLAISQRGRSCDYGEGRRVFGGQAKGRLDAPGIGGGFGCLVGRPQTGITRIKCGPSRVDPSLRLVPPVNSMR
jgi:hypothetical protein